MLKAVQEVELLHREVVQGEELVVLVVQLGLILKNGLIRGRPDERKIWRFKRR